jgi:hypothetical protein
VPFPTPVSKLSGAFLRPPSPMHLQFAYYESSMVVEYVAGRFGIEALQRVLADLANDVPIKPGAGEPHGADREVGRELRHVV